MIPHWPWLRRLSTGCTSSPQGTTIRGRVASARLRNASRDIPVQSSCCTPAAAVSLLLFGLGLFAAPLPAVASSFEVFCTDNSDGTRTCLGWEGGETLTCIRSSGSTITCSAPSGRSFVCTQTLGGVISCSNPPNRRDRAGPRCVLTGDGNLFCDKEEKPPAPLITPPSVRDAEEPLDAPALTPLLPGGLQVPSVFD